LGRELRFHPGTINTRIVPAFLTVSRAAPVQTPMTVSLFNPGRFLHAMIDLGERILFSDIDESMYGRQAVMAGWIHHTRVLGEMAFVLLRDRTGITQVTLEKSVHRNVPVAVGPGVEPRAVAPGESGVGNGGIGRNVFDLLTGQSRESVIAVKGTIRPAEQVKCGWEFYPEAAEVLSRAETPLPLGVADKVFADLDTRLDNRFLDLRRPEVAAIFKIRDTMMCAIHGHLRGEGFMEVHTPKIVATATEGGTDLFPVKYFESAAYLNQSPQLFKQMLMGSGMDRVYEVGPAFRAEKHDTVRHINEFISIDIEMSFADEEDAMGVLERLIRRVASEVAEKNAPEAVLINEVLIKRFNHHIEQENNRIRKENKRLKKENKKLRKKGEPERPYLPYKEAVSPIELEVPGLPLPRLTYTECIEIINGKIRAMFGELQEQKEGNAREGGTGAGAAQGAGKPATTPGTVDIPEPLAWGEDPSMEHFKLLAQDYPGLYYITRWPMSIKPFYVQPLDAENYDPADDTVVSRGFDLMYGHNEITSGAQRVHDPDLLVSRIEHMGLDPASFESYLAPFRYGMPPHAGWGLGVERLMMMLTNMYNVRECVLFPRDRYRLSP